MKILVPIKIEALVVDEITAGETNWVDQSLNYSMLSTLMGPDLQASEADYEISIYKKGVHLHWALPLALTNAVKKDNTMVFPPVPNRWLVVRTYLNQNKPVVKSWIIESDYIGDRNTATSKWVIKDQKGAYQDIRIGRAVDPADWTESASLTPALTAVAPGNPAFAATYQTCRNVFGFHDDLKGIDTADHAFSYSVSGWYADLKNDPLSNVSEIDKLIRENVASKWSIPTTGEPAETMCHGAVNSLLWNKQTKYGPDSGSIDVCLGNTSVEAKVSQLAAQKNVAEQLLNAFFYDALKDAPGIAEIEAQISDRSFTSFDGGTLWEIRRPESDTKAPNGKKTVQVFPDAAEYPGISTAFSTLNTVQRSADSCNRQKKTLQLEFRAVCDKLLLNPNSDIRPGLEAYRERLKSVIDNLNKLIAAAQVDIDTNVKIITSSVPFTASAKDAKPEFELTNKRMPRFWQPGSPVAVFSGPGIKESTKYKLPGNAVQLACRTLSDVTESILLNDGSSYGRREISPMPINLQLSPQGSLTAETIVAIEKLHREALMVDPSMAFEWAVIYNNGSRDSAAAKQLGAALWVILSLKEQAFPGVFKGVKTQTGAVISDTDISSIGLALFMEQRGIQLWAHPFTPINLVWRANWQPSYHQKADQFEYTQDVWTWKNKKYVYKGVTYSHTQISFSGKAILTDAITRMIHTRLPEAQIDYSISQALSSFHNALLMRLESVQLPLLTFDEKDGSIRDDHRFDEYLTTENYFFPQPDNQTGKLNHFFPVRAGQLTINRLWITDAFGQIKKVINEDRRDVKSAAYIAEHVRSTASSITLSLAPRIVQPSRLMFRWINAGDENFAERSSDPATNPVCGWLLPNYADNVLHIYDASGRKYGFLQILDYNAVGGTSGTLWHSAPGEEESILPHEIRNAYLRDFVQQVLNHADGGNILEAFFDLFKSRSATLKAGPDLQSIATLTGEPLALVRASLKFELMGTPAHPQGWNDEIRAASERMPPGLDNLRFPVTLGDTRNSNDGLVGFFADGQQQFHVSYGSYLPRNAYFTDTDINLSFHTDEKPAGLTLLLDPRGGVCADCGLLPSKMIRLEKSELDNGLKNMEIDFFVAPFLGTADRPFIPVSAESDSHWLLIQRQQQKWKNTLAGGQKEMEVQVVNEQRIQEGFLQLKRGASKE